MTSATASMIANVSRYWASFTVKVPRGGTNTTSNAATHSAAQAMAAPRLKRSATTTTARRYTIATFTMSNRGSIARPASVQAPAAATATT